MNPIENFQHVFNSLNKDNVEIVESLYAEDIHFIDPIHDLHGLSKLRDYFRNLYDGVESCRFDFHEIIRQDETAMLSWTMHLAHRKIEGGKLVAVPGVSHIRFADKVTYHHDYFDVGKMLYERIPVVGFLVKSIKNRL